MWPVRNKHLEPLITGFQFTSAATPAVSVDEGSDDFPSITRNGAGDVLAELYDLGLLSNDTGKGYITLVTPVDTGVADGAFGVYGDDAPGDGEIPAGILDTAGAGDDGSAHVLVAGWGSSDVLRYEDVQAVRSTLVAPRLAACLISSAGAVTIGGTLFQASKVDTGIYSVTLRPGFAKLRSLAVSAVNTTSLRPKISSASGVEVIVKIYSAAGALTDSAFTLMGLFSENIDGGGRCRDILRHGQMFPEIIAGRITYNAGTPEMSIGGSTDGIDATLVDTGTGDVAVTLSDTFERGLIVCASGLGSQVQVKATPTSSSFSLVQFDGAGVAEDDVSLNFIALGYRSTDEF